MFAYAYLAFSHVSNLEWLAWETVYFRVIVSQDKGQRLHTCSVNNIKVGFSFSGMEESNNVESPGIHGLTSCMSFFVFQNSKLISVLYKLKLFFLKSVSF